MQKINLQYQCQLKISYITILEHCLTTRPSLGAVPTCPSWDAVIQHALVATQFYDMPISGCSFTTCLVGTPFNAMPWSGRRFNTYPGRNAIYELPWSGCSYSTCPGREDSRKNGRQLVVENMENVPVGKGCRQTLLSVGYNK